MLKHALERSVRDVPSLTVSTPGSEEPSRPASSASESAFDLPPRRTDPIASTSISPGERESDGSLVGVMPRAPRAFFSTTSPPHRGHKTVVISGGTGANSIIGAFLKFSHSCNFVLPISDDGGSSAEIIRVLGKLA
jgi:hypothetical protein